jgi:hypothetical protein
VKVGHGEIVGYGLLIGWGVMVVVPSLLQYVFLSLAVPLSRIDIAARQWEIGAPSSHSVLTTASGEKRDGGAPSRVTFDSTVDQEFCHNNTQYNVRVARLVFCHQLAC